MTKINILIADDQPLIRDGLAAILGMQENYNIVATTCDGMATVKQVQLHRPHLVLMDIQMPKLDGLEATKQIKKEFPETLVLILTTFEDEEYIWKSILHGASGYLVKGSETEKILTTVKDCLNGRINYPFSIQMRLIEALQSSEEQDKNSVNVANTTPIPDYSQNERLECLSIQERNIVNMLKQGKSNQVIASELYLTTGTVKNYLSVIYRKLNVSSRTEAIAYLYENNL